MPSTVEQLSPTRVKITVEVPFAELKPSMDKAYREIAKSINIPGFRRGKVPPLVIDQRIGRGAIIQEAINDALPRLYGQAVSDNKLTPLAQPEVEVTRLYDGDSIEFVAEVDVRPDFDLPDFSTLTATVEEAFVTDEQIDERLEILRERFGSQLPVDRPAAEGDVVTINLLASLNGEPLPDASAENLEYIIGSGTMLQGLDEAVTGLAAGESATFTSTLLGGPLKDTEAEIEVRVTKVAEQELPELDDDFAEEASEFDTYEEMRADLKASLLNLARREQASRARDALLEDLVAKVNLDLPENLRAADLTARRESILSQLQAAGLSLADYLAESGEADSEDAFWADLEKRSADALRAQIILDKIAEDRGLQVVQDDLTQHILRKAQQQGSAPQQVADHLQEHPHHLQEYMEEIRRGKALSLIVAAAKVTDTAGNVVLLPEPADTEPGAPTTARADSPTDEGDTSDSELSTPEADGSREEPATEDSTAAQAPPSAHP